MYIYIYIYIYIVFIGKHVNLSVKRNYEIWSTTVTKINYISISTEYKYC